MFLPVQIPTVVEHQRPQGSQRIAGLFAPVHALMFLSAGDNQVVAFFDVGAADVLALRPTFSVIGNELAAIGQVFDQLVEFFDVLGLRAIFFQDVQSVLHLAAPKVFEQQAQQLGFGFSSAADQAGQVVAFLATVIPIQEQSRHRPREAARRSWKKRMIQRAPSPSKTTLVLALPPHSISKRNN